MVKLRGFSLIELVVVISLLSLLILAISSTLLMSIISSNRIRTTTKVKQAGNYALDQIQTMVHSAKEILSCDSGSSTLTIIGADGGTTTIAPEIVGSNTLIASGSGIYLTPPGLTAPTYTLSCLPSDQDPSLIKISFGLKDSMTTLRTTENPTLHFETSISQRN